MMLENIEDKAMPPPSIEPLLSVPEVAHLVHLSVHKTWELVWSGELASVKIASRRLVEPAAVRALIEAGKR